jgi:hypothetical protein
MSSKYSWNLELWERNGQSDINVEIKRRKFGWIGHTLQKSENEICHSALEWNPQGRMTSQEYQEAHCLERKREEVFWRIKS